MTDALMKYDLNGKLVPLADADIAQRERDAAAVIALPLPLPDISDAQFGQGLWHDGVITYAECMAFVQVGQLPATLEALLEHLPDDDTGQPTPRKSARADLAGKRIFQFDNPLVETIRELMEHTDPVWTVDHLRARWAVWATL